MFRVIVLFMLISVAEVLWAQPTPLSNDATKSESSPKAVPDIGLANDCICAGYPIYEEEGDVLYYSEVCKPAKDCTVSDVSYYWGEPTISWPLVCNVENPNGACQNCYDLNKKATRPPKNAAGLKSRFTSDTSAQTIFPASMPDINGVSARPRNGVKSEYSDHTFVKFTVDGDIKYAQLFIVKVNTSKAHAPGQSGSGQVPDRFLFIGYEVEYDPAEMANALPVTVDEVIGRTTLQAPSTSKFVRKVSVGSNKFLVLLKRRALVKE